MFTREAKKQTGPISSNSEDAVDQLAIVSATLGKLGALVCQPQEKKMEFLPLQAQMTDYKIGKGCRLCFQSVPLL